MNCRTLLSAVGLLSITLFSGCGGGGGGADTTPPNAPVITSPVTGVLTSDTTPTFSGTAEAGSTVEVLDGASPIGTCTATGGNWTFTPSTALAEGAHNITATAEDAAGNVSGASAVVVVNIDSVAPAAPVITAPADGTATNDSTPVISGTAEADSTVEVFENSVSIGTCTATGGNWTFTPSSALIEGDHALTATATDAANNTSGESTPVAIVVDTVAPDPAGTPTDNGTYDDADVTFSWTAASDATSGIAGYTLSIGTSAGNGDVGTFVLGNVLTYTYTLPVGMYNGSTLYAHVHATDAAGNTCVGSGNSDGVIIDKTAPGTPGACTDAGAYDNASVTFSWTAASDPQSGIASYILEVGTTLGGSNVFNANVGNVLTYDITGVDGQILYGRVMAVNGAGMTGAYSTSSDGITVDTIAPPSTANNKVTNDTTPSLSGTVSDAGSGVASVSVEVNAIIYTSPAQVTFGGGTWSIADGVVTALGDGTYDITVTAVDAVGNSASDSTTNELLVDTIAPGAPGTPTDRGLYDNDSCQFDWTAATDVGGSGIASYILQVGTFPGGSAVYNGNVGNVLTYTVDATTWNGWTLYARVCAVDNAGNSGTWSGDSDGVTIDTNPPFVSWSYPFDGSTNVGLAQTVQIQFSESMDQASVQAAFSLTPAASNGYIFEWNGGGDYVTITPDTANPVGLTNADILIENQLYSFVVASTATDLAGNALSAMTDVDFTSRDQTPPELISAMVNATDALLAPVAVNDVQVGDTIVLEFDETMESTRGRVSIETPSGEIQAYYDNISLRSAVRLTNVTTYETWWDHNFNDGETVTVINVWPDTFNTTGSVTVIDPTHFTLPNPGIDESASGFGQVYIRRGNGATLLWTSATELTVTLEMALSAGMQYNVEIWDVSDDSWNSIWNLSFALQVEQSASIDTTPPVLIASLPSNGLTNIDRMMVVMLLFNEPIARDSLDNLTINGVGVSKADFNFSDGSGEGGGDMGGGYAYSYEPKMPMPANTAVTVTVPVTVTDLAGNGLTSPTVFTFTTTAANETGAPTIDASIPSDGETNAAQWGDIIVSFKDTVTSLPDPIDEATLGLDDISVHDDTDNVTMRGWTPSLDGKYAVRISNWSGPGLQQGHDYTVTIGPGISDIYGNAMAASETITFRVADVAENRSPTLDDLDIELSGNTGPEAIGRELSGRLSVRDEDNDPVDVTIQDVRGAGYVTITGTVPDPQNYSEFQVGGDGGPPMAMTPNMTDANYSTSGYYDFTVTLDDGTSTNTYTTKVWVWRPDATPQLVSVGGVSVSTTEVITISTNTPTFVWDRVDTANADYIQLAIFDAGAIGGDSGPGSAFALMFYLPASVTSYTIPAEMPMPTGIYLWTVIEAKARPGLGDPAGQGWALDMLGAIMTGTDLSPFFVYSPDAATLTSEYGVAEIGASMDKEQAFDSAGDFNGIYTFDGVNVVDYDVYDSAGTNDTGSEVYAYDAPELVVTRGSPVLPGRGWTGRSGNLILQAQSSRGIMDIVEEYILVGAKRFATTGFTTADSLDGTWSFIQGEMDVTGGTFNGAYCNIGTALCLDGTATVTIKDLTGATAGPFPVPYTVAADGKATLDVGGYTVSGYIGGAGLGSEILVMATDSNADRPFWIMMAKQYSLAGKTVADISGTYYFVQLQMNSTPWAGAYTAWGTVTCDGAGNYTYQYYSPFNSGSGSNTYSVAGGEVVVNIDGGCPLHMYAGPDVDTLYGISMDAANEAVTMIIMSK